jgi:hypothetical protein
MSGAFSTRKLAAPDCTDLARAPAVARFAEVVHCATGNRKRPVGPDNVAQHILLARTMRGWWSLELARDRWPHGDSPDEQPWVAEVGQLAVGDRLGDGGAEIIAIAQTGPAGGDKTRRVIVCGNGPSETPACADVRIAAGGPFHGAGALLYRFDLACDGTFSLAGWEGGSPVKLVHGHATLRYP